MKKNIITIVICSILSLAFIAGGLFCLISYNQKQAENKTAIAQLQKQQEELQKNTSGKDAETLQQSNDLLQQEVDTLEATGSTLSQHAEDLQKEYETLSQDETVIYYQTILAELLKGMEKVEGYINDAQ